MTHQFHSLRRSFVAVGSTFLLLAGFFTLVTPPASAGATGVSITDGPNGAVTAAVADPSTGITYVGGSFTRWGAQTGSGASIASDGTPNRSFPQVTGGNINASMGDGSGGFYIGGSFTAVGGIARTRLAHILSTGDVDLNWAPSANNTVWSMALNGSTVIVGGQFSSVTSTSGSTSSRTRVAAFASNGSVTSWAPSANGTVSAIVVAGASVYLGGSFTSVTPSGGSATPRGYLAALSTTGTGSLTSWAPAAGGAVSALAVSGSTVYAGGSFTTVTPVGGSSTSRSRLAAFSTE